MPLPEKKYNLLSDHELLNIYKSKNDHEIVGILFKKYLLMCLAVATKYLNNEEKAKDLVMQVFEKLLGDLSNHKIENFKGWLYAVVKNACLMQIRKEKNIEFISTEKDKSIYTNVEKQYYLHQSNESLLETDIAKLEKAIAELNHEQKVCIDLFYIQNKSYAEVANLSGFDLHKVKSNIQNGKRNLKLKLQSINEK